MKVPAIRYTQGEHTLYSFVMNAKEIHQVARVSTLGRDDDGNVVGFQRGEVASHIRNIANYLNEGNPMIPNSIILGFTKPPRFSPLERGSDVGFLTLSGQNALIVDGQQRSAAFRDSNLTDFPMNVVGFVAESDAMLNEHFMRVNSSKPLSTSLLRALVPTVDAVVDPKYRKERIPLLLIERLNRDEDSPFKGRIKNATNPAGYIAENTVIKALIESLVNGYLYNLLVEDDTEGMVGVLKRFWGAVAEVFGEAWDLPPSQSRLTHAAGIRALSAIMDQIGDQNAAESLAQEKFAFWLGRLKPACKWTEGSGNWNFGPVDGSRPWDGIENTEKSIKILVGYLTREYRKMLKKGAA